MPSLPSDFSEKFSVTSLILSIVRDDGEEAQNIPFMGEDIFLGAHAERILPEKHDTGTPQAAALHVFRIDAGKILLQDISEDGLFRRMGAQEKLRLPCEVRFGNHRCLLEAVQAGQDEPLPGFWGAPLPSPAVRMTDVVNGGIAGDTFLLSKGKYTVGRESGDIVFFPTDGFISGAHAVLTLDDQSTLHLTDLGSSNGTFIRLPPKCIVALTPGQEFLLGRYLIKIT